MSNELDLNYEPFEYADKSIPFAQLVKKELALFQDEEHQQKLKQEAEAAENREVLARKNALIEDIKGYILSQAKKGQRILWVEMNQREDFWDKNGELLSKDIDGLKARWEHSSGSCGNHGYNSYDDYYYVIEW